MVLHSSAGQPLTCLKQALRSVRFAKLHVRPASTKTTQQKGYRTPPPAPPRNDPWAPVPMRARRVIQVFRNEGPGSGNALRRCPEPLKTFNASQIALLDPSGARTRLFAKDNKERVNMGDVLLVRFKNGDPFYGVCMSLRRRGPDTGILLRNTVMRVATEMWIKIYNPTVAGIEIVQRAERRARRGRLTYLRKPEHDRGDLSSVLNEYSKTRRTLNTKKKIANSRVKKTLSVDKTAAARAKAKGPQETVAPVSEAT